MKTDDAPATEHPKNCLCYECEVQAAIRWQKLSKSRQESRHDFSPFGMRTWGGS